MADPSSSLLGSPELAADAMEDAAARLAELVAAGGSLDARAVMLGLCRTHELTAEAVRTLAGQKRFGDLDPGELLRIHGALSGLRDAAALFEEIANGWI